MAVFDTISALPEAQAHAGQSIAKNVFIRLGDCLIPLRAMPAASVGAVVTSPPYNLGKKYNVHNDNMPEAGYLAFMGDVAKELRRVMKPDGHMFLNVGWNTKHPWRSIDVLLTFRPYFELQNMIAWIKLLAIDGSALPDDLKTLPALKAWLDSVGLPTAGREGVAIRRGLCAALRTDMHERTIGHMPSLNSDHYLNPGWKHTAKTVCHEQTTYKVQRTATTYPSHSAAASSDDGSDGVILNRLRHCERRVLVAGRQFINGMADITTQIGQ
jgi:hypothetical protein